MPWRASCCTPAFTAFTALETQVGVVKNFHTAFALLLRSLESPDDDDDDDLEDDNDAEDDEDDNDAEDDA